MQKSVLSYNGHNGIEKKIDTIANHQYLNQEKEDPNKDYVTWKKGDTIFIKPNYIAPLGGPIAHSYIDTSSDKTHLVTTLSKLGWVYAVAMVVFYVAAGFYVFFTYAGTPEFTISMLVMALFGIAMAITMVVATLVSVRAQHDHLKRALRDTSTAQAWTEIA